MFAVKLHGSDEFEEFTMNYRGESIRPVCCSGFFKSSCEFNYFDPIGNGLEILFNDFRCVKVGRRANGFAGHERS